MTDSKSKIESRVGRMLRQFDPGLYRDYSNKTRLFNMEYLKNSENFSSLTQTEDELVTGEKHPVFYMSFNEPVYLTFSNPISMFKRKSGKITGKSEGSKYSFEIGIVPVYFASMNMMSMFKLYSTRAVQVFDPYGGFFDEMKCIELSHKKGIMEKNPVHFSSMNIIEQSTAKESLADEMISKLFYDKYFTLGFWMQPERGFVPSTHFEFDKKINAIFKLSKSLYKIDSLGKKETVSILGNDVDVYTAIVRGVWVNTLHFGQPFEAKIESSVLDSLNVDGSKLDLFLNGIMMEIRSMKNKDEMKFEKIMTVCTGYSLSYFDMIQLAIGMICNRICREPNTVSFLADFTSFKNIAEIICKDWMRELSVREDLSGKLSNPFETSLELMFPLVVTDGNKMYHTNPLIIGFLKKWDLLFSDSKKLKEVLLLLLPLLDKISKMVWTERRFIQTNDGFKSLYSFVKNPMFLSALIRLVQEINTSNILKKTYQTEPN